MKKSTKILIFFRVILALALLGSLYASIVFNLIFIILLILSLILVIWGEREFYYYKDLVDEYEGYSNEI